ncbi:hypothetical protein Leryth_003239 [Lithospermum erythrorhizon]|nr:hypothetical protein Leryth_003239 [Lithospermum erythrorhizon]
MRGTKRSAGSDSSSVFNDSLGKRIFAGRQTDFSRPESSHTRQQQVSLLPLDVQRAELSRQHVRALNTQFASWVQSQLQNHPDELWQDGPQDYINHAFNIMETFADVVNWLKTNVVNGESVLVSGSEQKNIETDSRESKKSETAVTSSTGTIGSLWGFGNHNNVLSDRKGVDNPFSNTPEASVGSETSIDEKSGGVLQSTAGIFGGSWGSGGQKSSESKQSGSTLSSEKANNYPASTSASFGVTTPSFGGTAASFQFTTPRFGGTAASFGGTTPSFGSSQSSGTSFNNNAPFSFGS